MAAGAKGILLVPSDYHRDRADGQKSPKGRDSGDHARYVTRSAHRRRRQYRHRQFQGRRIDRPMGEGDAWRQGRHGQDRDPRWRRQQSVGRLFPPQRLPHRVRHPGQRSETLCAKRQPADRRLRRDAGVGRRWAQGDGEHLQKASEIDVVYAINEPAADGGFAALKAAGKDKGVLVVAVDGGCPGVKSVKAGIIGATSQQYPLLMAADGVQADRRLRQDRQEARQHRQRRAAHHRPSRAGRSFDRHYGRREALLGLIFPAIGSLMS